MKETAKRLLRGVVGDRCYDHWLYRRHHRWLLRHNGFANRRAVGEEAYRSKWRLLSPCVEPYSYRLFSHYCGPTPDIIPEDIMHDIVELKLNPREYWDVYEDKNNFSDYVDSALLPRTVAMRQGGGPMVECTPLSSLEEPLILKPSVGTSCGESIIRFDRVGEGYAAADGSRLSASFLEAYGPDWVLQEVVSQHPLMRRFCPTAVSTVRVVTYRSVADDEPHVTACVLRVGKAGTVVDNIVAGGRFLAVDIADGRIKPPFISRFGSRDDVWNGVNVAAGDFRVPCWDAVVELALHVSRRIAHHRLLALDIAVSDKEKPMLIEYNIGGFTTYLFHFTGQTVFGPWTDEVIAHCRG